MRKHIIPILSLAILLVACGGGGNTLDAKKAKLAKLKADIVKLQAEIKELDTTKVAGRTRLVTMSPVVASNFTHYIELQGNVVADQEIYVTPKMPGTITRVLVSTGNQVKAGQLIAELDGNLFVQNKAALQTQLDLATNLLQKTEQLWNQKIGTEVQYLQAKNGVESLQRQMSILDEQADMMRVYAPISGVVDEVTMKVGQPSSPGAYMSSIRIINLSKLKIKSEVPEAYAGKLREGGAAQLVFPDLQREINSKISYIGKVVSPTNRTFIVELAVPGGSKDLMPNLTTQIKIADYSKPNSIVVPINTVQKDLEGDFVFVASQEGGKQIAHKVRVKIGQVFGEQAEVLSGLKSGDQLVVTGFQDINEGEILKTQ